MMESIIIKQESHADESMDVSMDLQEAMEHEMDGMDGIEAFPPDIEKLKGGLVDMDESETNAAELNATTNLSVVSMPSSAVTSQLRMVNLTNTTQTSGVPSQNSQILVRPGGQTQLGQSTIKKLATTEGQKLVTKYIIAPKAGSSQQQLLSVGPHGLQPVLNASSAGLIGQPGVASSVQLATSPSKTYTLSQGGVLSPQQKLLTSSTVSGSKLHLSPCKTPPKQTVITFTKSPQKPQYIMLTKSGAATIPTSRPVTMSPSKLVVRGQPSLTLTSASQSQQSLIVSQAASTPRSGTTQAGTVSNIPGSIQQLPVSGSKFQYVRLVSAPVSQAQTTGLRQASIAPAPQRALTPAATNSAPVKITMPINSNQSVQQVAQQKQALNPAQRLILPATSQVLQGASGGSSSARQSVVSNSSTGSGVGPTINLQGIQGFALIPAQYIQSQASSQQSQPATTVVKQESFHVVASNNNTKQNINNINGRGSTTTEASGQRPRKPCNCTKSQCLKLYCDCFANGEFCANCNCNNCYNNLEHEEERQRAIKTCLERNPNAFHPKIGKGRGGTSDRRHNKGCNCKRSGCLKNYCECYEAKIMCSSLCKCVGCKNFEESPDRKTLMHLADAAEVRHQQQTAAKTKLSSQIQDVPGRPPPPATGQRLPYTFVTPEVAEATCACLVAQAEEAERTRQQEMMEERMILQEFGRCLMQVIQSATKTKAPSPVP